MIFGISLQPLYIEMGGAVTFLLLVLQILVGKRIIHFDRRYHQKVHRWLAWAVLAFAAIHGFLGLAMINGWTLL